MESAEQVREASAPATLKSAISIYQYLLKKLSGAHFWSPGDKIWAPQNDILREELLAPHK